MSTALHCFPNLDALTQYAADWFVTLAAAAVAERGRFLAVLSGGGTPQPLYNQLAQPSRVAQIPWQQTHFFWGDERCVSPDDPGSNYGQVKESLLDYAPMPASNVHRIYGELSPSAAAADYARRLAAFASAEEMFPRFDLVLLGMGSDGHTASLFPGFMDAAVAQGQLTLAVTGDYDGRPANRVTLTPLALNGARQAVFLVAGQEKAAALAQVWAGDEGGKLPASYIRPTSGQLTWLVDTAAASLLEL